MSITTYTNFENLDKRTENEGKYLLDKDINIISKNQKEFTDFGDCYTDVMEVSIYDINNNLLPSKDGDSVTYIKSEKIKKYLYKVKRKSDDKENKILNEIALDAKTLLNDLGFENGILKININFVKNRVGDENKDRRAWIQEISPSRQEIRILPLKVNDKAVDKQNKNELLNLKNLNKEFKFFRKTITDIINNYETIFLSRVDDLIREQYGEDFFTACRRDFGLSKFDLIQNKIYQDFRTAVDHYLNNRGYKIQESNFGRPSPTRFVDCDIYETEDIFEEIMSVLYQCVDYNLQFLKRRDIDTRGIPKEFKPVDLTPNIKNITGLIPPVDEVTVVYDPTATIPKPINNNTAVVRNKIDVETYLKYAEAVGLTQTPADEKPPTEVKVNPVPNTFSHKIVNRSSRSSGEVFFTDATGTTVRTIVGPGETVIVCAVENSISFSNIQALRNVSGYSANQNTNVSNDYSVSRMDRCNTVDISRTAPKPVAGYNTPPVSGYTQVSGYTTVRPSGYTTTNSTTNTVLPTNVSVTVGGYSSTPPRSTTIAGYSMPSAPATTTPTVTTAPTQTITTPPRPITTTTTTPIRGGGGGGGGSFGGYSIGGYNRF